MRSLLLESVRLSSRREGAIVLFLCDCSQHIPSQATTHAFVSNSARSWQMLMYLVRIPRRKGHSNQSSVRICHGGQPHPRRRSSWPLRQGSQSAVADRIEQPGWILAFLMFLSLCECYVRVRLRRPVIRRGSPPGEANGPGG